MSTIPIPKTPAKRGRLAVKNPSAYDGTRYSFFRDLVACAWEDRQSLSRQVDELQLGRLGVDLTEPLFGSRSETGDQGTVRDARERLASSQSYMDMLYRSRGIGTSQWDWETRDITSADPGAGTFLPAGATPSYIASEFAISARRRAVLATALRNIPLPAAGLDVRVPRLTTGATVAAQTEAATVSETDVDGTPVIAPVALISGQQDLSVQALERSLPTADVWIAAELGAALGEALDVQLLTGSGVAPNMLGLLTATGTTNSPYVDASATQAEAWPILTGLYASVATALGIGPDLTIMHPRRAAWFLNWKDTAGAQVRAAWPTKTLEVPAMPTNLGAGTEDAIVMLNVNELPLAIGPVKFRVMFEPLSGTLGVRIQATQFAAFIPNRRPEAIGKSGGTGFIAPVFT